VKPEWIDLLMDQLDDAQAEAVRAELARDPAATREFERVARVLGVMHRAERIEPDEEGRARLMRAARRATRPGLLQRAAALPGLVAFRYRSSLAFRVALFSLAAHFVVLGLLFQVKLDRARPALPEAFVRPGLPPDVPSDELPDDHVPPLSFVRSLAQRRAPHEARLMSYGIDGQAGLIEDQLEVVVADQRPDGSWGDLRQTSLAALTLLAEGESSRFDTPRGRALRRAMAVISRSVDGGESDGFALAALVEDYGLACMQLSADQRSGASHRIRRLIADLAAVDPAAREGLALAKLAGFQTPHIDLRDAAVLLSDRREALLGEPPTRLRVTAVLARGESVPDRERVREWARPLFEHARELLADPARRAEALLTLQAPYRL